MKDKSGMMLVIGGPDYKKDKSEDSAMSEKDDGGDLKAKSVKTLFQAMKAGDEKAGAAALEAFMEACGYGAPEAE